MPHQRRVVVTGLGAITPLGLDAESTWDGMLAGRSGVGQITLFDASEYRTTIAAEVDGYDPLDHFDRREIRRLDRYTQFFLVAVREALTSAGLEYTEDDPEATRAGVFVGAGFGGMGSFIDEVRLLDARGPGRVSPTAIPQIIPNMAAGLASMEHHLLGPVSCVVTACSASANAIGDATELIRRGSVEVMVAGGAEAAINEFGVASFAQARALSTRNDDPEAASRPFDIDRDGFVMGEGGAALILEEREHAIARSASILAEVTGYGMSADAYHITLPRPGGTGAARAMTMAIDDAGILPSDLSYLNAHGTSTPANDSTETLAIKIALGESAMDVPVSSIKSMTGHTLGAAGAVEALACILAIRDGRIAPTVNLDNLDPECELDHVANEFREAEVTHTISNSFGFGGHNVALVFSRDES
ncbi:MAG: beta-ketoacyl-ACP synthase II [Acidimicrobiia bacterium]|nr:beta-ketoacyl-ACP synthase II [Acidimicrobiia bacterium]